MYSIKQVAIDADIGSVHSLRRRWCNCCAYIARWKTLAMSDAWMPCDHVPEEGQFFIRSATCRPRTPYWCIILCEELLSPLTFIGNKSVMK